MGVLVKCRQFKPSAVELFVIDDHAAIFHVQYLHDGLVPVDKNIHLATEHVSAHHVCYYSAQGVKTLAHVNRRRIQIIAKGFMQMKHSSLVKQLHKRTQLIQRDIFPCPDNGAIGVYYLQKNVMR